MSLTQERPIVDPAARSVGYATLLVHAEPGVASRHRVEVAAGLARDLGARLIGLGAETLDAFPAPDPSTGYAGGEWLALMQEQLESNLIAAEKGFRRDAAGAESEWRAVQAYPTHAMARLARAADLLVVSPRSVNSLAHTVDPADLVMSAGRPVLMTPPGQSRLRGKAVLVGWNDSREARRAIADALPLLQRAEDVVVQSVCHRDDYAVAVEETADVVEALKRHAVRARAVITDADPNQAAAALYREAELAGADLIVTGAYGHSRAREWALGGVTDDFIHAPECFILMSH